MQATEETTDKDMRLRKYINRIEVAEKWRDNAFKDKWTRYYKRWRNHVDRIYDKHGKEITDRSNISVPFTFTQIETIIPRLVETLFAARPYVTVKGRKQEFSDNASSMETLLDYQQNEVFDIQNTFHIGLKILALFGTTVAYTGWKIKEREVIRKELGPVVYEDSNGPMMDRDGQPIPISDPNTGEVLMDWQQVSIKDKEYDDPEVKFLDLGHFYVDPNAEDIADALYCGHRCYMTKEQLQVLEEQGFLDKIDWEKVEKNDRSNDVRNDRMSAIGIPLVKNDNQNADASLYECHYYWEDDKLAFIINRSYLARDSENPFWHKKKPYVKDTYTKVPGEFYGIGIVEIIEDQQDELNTERNMRIDYRAHNLRRMFKVKRDSNINPNDLVWRQNGRIMVDDMGDIEVFNPPSIQGDTFNQEQIVKQDMQDATGAQDVVIGSSSSGETATTTMSKDNNASMRFKLIISSVEKRLLVGVSRFMIQLNQQFIDDVRVLPMFSDKGDEWPEITPEQIQGEFHLIASGSSVEPMANKEAHKQRMLEAFGLVANNPIMQQYPDKIVNMLRKVLESMEIKDTDDILPTEEDLITSQSQQVMQQLMQMLPPEVAQMVQMSLQQSQTPMMPDNAVKPSVTGGGMNRAMQAERGLQVVGGGG